MGTQKITGYRDLSQAEIDLVNEIKAEGESIRDLIERIESHQFGIGVESATVDGEAKRWLAIGRTQLQQGVMALTRAVTKPESF